jgi:hypothetical protein
VLLLQFQLFHFLPFVARKQRERRQSSPNANVLKLANQLFGQRLHKQHHEHRHKQMRMKTADDKRANRTLRMKSFDSSA